MIKGDIRKLRKQRFFHDALQTYGRDWIRLTKMKKNSLIKNLLLALKKKNSSLFTIFPDFLSIFQNFLQVWKIAGQISRLFFQEFKALYEPCHPQYQETFLQRNFALTVRTCVTVSWSFARMTFLWNVSACATILAGDLSHFALVKAS